MMRFATIQKNAATLFNGLFPVTCIIWVISAFSYIVLPYVARLIKGSVVYDGNGRPVGTFQDIRDVCLSILTYAPHVFGFLAFACVFTAFLGNTANVMRYIRPLGRGLEYATAAVLAYFFYAYALRYV